MKKKFCSQRKLYIATTLKGIKLCTGSLKKCESRDYRNLIVWEIQNGITKKVAGY